MEWIYTNLENPSGGFEQDYLSEDFFTFTFGSESITELSLYLPQRFDFALPPGDPQSSRLLEISFNGELLASVPIVIDPSKYNELYLIY